MEQASTMTVRRLGGDAHALMAHFPVPGLGVVPVNAFVIPAAQPVLVDTGLGMLQDEFMAQLRAVLDPDALRWIWLTHIDPDHIGNLRAVLAAAPQARVVTSFLGLGKLGLHQIAVERVLLLNPGQRLDVGDRELLALRPPTFDAPETTAAFDTRTRTLFSSDSFGALLQAPVEDAGALAADELREGVVTWATVDAPWLASVQRERFAGALQGVRDLRPQRILSSHLPPATGEMLDTLLALLDSAREAPPFVGPDQAALEQMMAHAQPSAA